MPINASVPADAKRSVNVNPEATREFFVAPRLAGSRDRLKNPYKQHGMVYAALKATASNIAQVPFLIHTGASEESEDIVRDGPWVELFDRPNPVTKTRAKFWEMTILQLYDRGESFWVKEGAGEEGVGPNEIPTELWPINGKLFDPVIDKETKLPVAWVYRAPGEAKPIVYEPHQLVIHQFTDPENSLRGLGPLEAAALAYTTDFKAARFNEKFFDNDATPGGILVTDKPLNAQQRHNIREAWEERHQGTERRRRIAMLEGGLQYQATGETHREMEFEALRRMSWKEILAIVGVPELVVGLTENLNMATAQVEEKGWWVRHLFPVMRLIEDGAWEQLFRMPEGDARSAAHAAHRDVARRLWNAARRERVQMRRKYVQYRDYRDTDYLTTAPERKKSGADVWGEFDLSTVEALRENFAEKATTANTLRTMGYPLNAVNERLDLGMEKLPPEVGDVSMVPSTMTSAELAIEPPEPPVVAAPGMGAKPKDEEEKPAPKPKKEEKDEKKVVDAELLRQQVSAFVARRPAEHDSKWRAIVRQTEPLEARFRAKFTRWLKELRDHQLKRLARWPHVDVTKKNAQFVTRAGSDKLTPEQIAKVLFEQKSWGQRLVSLEHGVYVDAAKTGIEGAINEIGGNFAFNVVDPRVVDVIKARELKLAKVSETVNKLVEKALKSGVENGETIAQLQDRIKPYFNQMASSRSLMVARTEVAGAVNSSRDLVYGDEGVDATQWITARDEAVRDSHAAIDGDIAPRGTPFANGLLYPGDPAGEAGEVINCRCVAIPAKMPGKKIAHVEQTRDENGSTYVLPSVSIPQINVHVPPAPAPVVHVERAPVNVTVQPAPVVVAPTPAPVVKVNIPAPVVNVPAPIVNVEAPKQEKKRGPTIVKLGTNEDGDTVAEIEHLDDVPEGSD